MNRRRLITAATLAPLLPPLLGACGRDDPTGEWYSNWDLDGGCASRLPALPRQDAQGRVADICPVDAAGAGWTWVFYGADWCQASRSQAARIAEFDRRSRDWLEVLTVLTSAEPLVVPKRSDALAWAARTGLPPARVLFAPQEDDPRTVPQHLLIGPAGATQWRWIGVLEVAEMVDIATGFRDGTRQPRVRRLPQR